MRALQTHLMFYSLPVTFEGLQLSTRSPSAELDKSVSRHNPTVIGQFQVDDLIISNNISTVDTFNRLHCHLAKVRALRVLTQNPAI
jgi:hypothetical protein